MASYRIRTSVEGRRTNESQQTTGISHVDDWLTSNPTPKYSPTLFLQDFNQKLIFLHSYQHLPAIKCPQRCSFKRHIFIERVLKNKGNNVQKSGEEIYLPGGAKFRKRQIEEPSGCACTNGVHIHAVQAGKRNASTIHSAATWNAAEGSGMVSDRFVHRSELDLQTLVLFLKHLWG